MFSHTRAQSAWFGGATKIVSYLSQKFDRTPVEESQNETDPRVAAASLYACIILARTKQARDKRDVGPLIAAIANVRIRGATPDHLPRCQSADQCIIHLLSRPKLCCNAKSFVLSAPWKKRARPRLHFSSVSDSSNTLKVRFSPCERQRMREECMLRSAHAESVCNYVPVVC